MLWRALLPTHRCCAHLLVRNAHACARIRTSPRARAGAGATNLALLVVLAQQPDALRAAVCATPQLLALLLASWHGFFVAWGLSSAAF